MDIMRLGKDVQLWPCGWVVVVVGWFFEQWRYSECQFVISNVEIERHILLNRNTPLCIRCSYHQTLYLSTL